MSVEWVLVMVMVLLLVLLVSEVPIAFTLAVAGLAGIVALDGVDAAARTLARVPYGTPARYALIVVPMFIVMGAFARHAGIAEDAYRLAQRALRRVPGGLGLATICACAGFAAVSGSSIATVATIGRLSIEEMRKNGYDTRFAAGIVASGGTLGVLIPPSIILVLYAVIVQIPIGPMLMAGIVPGILSAAAYMAYVVIRARLQPQLTGRGAEASVSAVPGEKQRSPLPGLVALIFLFVIVMGGIYGGVFTATEAGAVGAVAAGAVLLVAGHKRRGSLKSALGGSIADAVSLTSMALMIVIGGAIFTFFLVLSRLPTRFTEWVLGLGLPNLLLVALILLMFIPIGALLDPLSSMFIVVPLVIPAVVAMGYSPIWFGILVVKMIEIGLVTPPVGLNTYVVAGTVEDLTTEDVFKGIAPLIPVDLAVTAVLFAFPAIVLWLPGAMS